MIQHESIQIYQNSTFISYSETPDVEEEVNKLLNQVVMEIASWKVFSSCDISILVCISSRV